MVSAAVLTLLAECAEEAPLLCLLNDAHWIDRPSIDALVFAARRLDADRSHCSSPSATGKSKVCTNQESSSSTSVALKVRVTWTRCSLPRTA